MPGSGAEDFEIWKKQSWDLGLDEASRLSELAETRPVVFGGGRTWWGQMEKSGLKEILSLSLSLSLSPYVEKP